MRRTTSRFLSPRPFLAVVATVLVSTSCGARTERDLGAHMDEHFGAAVDIQTALIRGDVSDAREQAVWLERHPTPPGIPQGARTHLEALRAAARAVAAADGINEASRATARLAFACGSCHAATGAGPGFLPGGPPGEGTTVAQRMARHIWAADRMWEALVSQSDASWEAGAEVLAVALLSPRFVTADTAALERMNDLVDHVAGVATFAQRDRGWERRAELYGELLPTCSACHQIVGVDPLGVPGDAPLP